MILTQNPSQSPLPLHLPLLRADRRARHRRRHTRHRRRRGGGASSGGGAGGDGLGADARSDAVPVVNCNVGK